MWEYQGDDPSGGIVASDGAGGTRVFPRTPSTMSYFGPAMVAAQRAPVGGLAGPADPGLAALVASQRDQQRAGMLAAGGGSGPPTVENASGVSAPPPPAALVSDAGTGGYSSPPPAAPQVSQAAAVVTGAYSGGYSAAPAEPRISTPPPAPPMSVDPNFGKPTAGGPILTGRGPGAGDGQQQGRGGGMGERAEMYIRGLDADNAANRASRPWSAKIAGGKFQTAESQVSQNAIPDEALARLAAAKRGVGAVEGQLAENDAAANASQAENLATRGQVIADHDASVAAVREQGRAEMNGIYQQIKNKQAEVGATEIDPTKWWTEGGTGKTIGATLAIALGGLGEAIMGRNGPNGALGIINKAIDENISAQHANLANKKAQLSELGQIYAFTRERSGDDVIAANTAKAAALEQVGLDAQRRALESGSQKAVLNAAKLRAQTEEEIARLIAENEGRKAAQISKQFVVTQDRVVSGGGYDRKRELANLKEGARVEGDVGELDVKRTTAGRAAAGAQGPQGVVVGGKFYQANPGVPHSFVEKANERLAFADVGLETLDALDKRRALGIDGDPGADVIAGTNALTQAIGGGVGGESDKAEYRAAMVGVGPSGAAARQRLREKLISIKQQTIASIGAKP